MYGHDAQPTRDPLDHCWYNRTNEICSTVAEEALLDVGSHMPMHMAEQNGTLETLVRIMGDKPFIGSAI